MAGTPILRVSPDILAQIRAKAARARAAAAAARAKKEAEARLAAAKAKARLAAAAKAREDAARRRASAPPSAPPGAPSAPPSAPAGPTPAELARQRELEARAEAARKAVAEAKRRIDEARIKADELKRKEEERRRESAKKAMETARQRLEETKRKRAQIEKAPVFGLPVPTPLRGLIEEPVIKPAVRVIKEPPTKVKIPTVEPKEEPTPSPPLTVNEQKLMTTGIPKFVKLAEASYKRRTGQDMPKPEPEPLTFEEKLRVYGGVRQKVLDIGEERPIGTLVTRAFRREPEEIAESHMEKEIVSSLAENEVTPESISEIAKSYNENLEKLKDASEDSRWQIGDDTYTRDEAIKYAEENTPEYVLKDVKGVGYSYPGKTIDLIQPGAYDKIVDFYTGSQEFVGGVLQDQAINQAYKDTINANPSVKYIIDYYRKTDPNKADEIEHHLRKDIENQYSYTPKEPTSDKVIQQLFQKMPESDQTKYHIKYTFPDEDIKPIDIIGVPGSYKYFSGVTGPKKTEIVGEIYDLYKKGKLPEIMGPGGLGFKRLLGKKIRDVDVKKHNQRLRDYRKLLMNQGFGRKVPVKEMVSFKGEKKQYLPGLSLEGEKKLRAYEEELNDERTKTVIWNTLTDPEYTEKVYEKMGTIPRVIYQMGEAAVTVAAIPITLPQAVIKLATGKTIGIDIAKGLESYRYGPKGVWTVLSQEAMSKAGIGAPVSEKERLQIKERPAEFFAASLGEAVSFYGVGKATKLIHAPLAARGVKIPSVTGLARRGLRYMAPRAKREITRVFGPKLSTFGKPYFPTTMQQISKVPVGKWITPGRGVLGREVSRRGLAYVTKTTRPFTKVITERVPRTLGKGFRERIVSEVTTPKPTLLGRAQMIRKELGLIDDTVGYRVSRIPREAGRIPGAAVRLRTTAGKGLEQFRYDWRLPTKEGYRLYAGEPIAKRGLGTTLETGYKRFVGLERKVGRAVKEEVSRAATGEKPGLLGTQKGTYIKTVYKRAGGSKWIPEKEYNKIVEMFSKKGIKKIGKAESIKLGNKYYYQDAAGNITETTKAVATSPDVKQIIAAVAEQETLKKAAILKPVRPSLRTTMKVFRGEVESGRLAQQMRLPSALREAGRLGRITMRGLERRPTAAVTSRVGRITTPVSAGRPYAVRDVFTTGLRVGRERVGALKGRLAKRAVVKEVVEERIKPYTYATPRGGQYYIGRLRPVAETVKRGVKREAADFYFPTTPAGGKAIGLAGRGLGFTGLGLGLGYRDRLDTIGLTDVEEAERRISEIKPEVEQKQIVTPVAITERMPARGELRGMLPWQAQPQISAMLPMDVQRQKPGFIQEQALQQQLVPIQQQVGMELELHKPKFPLSIEDEELEERRRREMLQRQQTGIGYKEREYKVPDIWGTRRVREASTKQQFFSLTPQQSRKVQQTITTVKKPVKRKQATKQKPIYSESSIWDIKAK